MTLGTRAAPLPTNCLDCLNQIFSILTQIPISDYNGEAFYFLQRNDFQLQENGNCEHRLNLYNLKPGQGDDGAGTDAGDNKADTNTETQRTVSIAVNLLVFGQCCYCGKNILVLPLGALAND